MTPGDRQYPVARPVAIRKHADDAEGAGLAKRLVIYLGTLTGESPTILSEKGPMR